MRWTIDGEQAYLLSRGAREGEMVVLWELLGRQASGASWRGAMEATRPRGDDAGAAAARQGTCQLKASSSRGGRPSTAGWEADLREVRGGGGGVVLRGGGQGEGQGRGGGGGTGREAGPGERPRARVVERFCPRTTAAAGAKRPSRAKTGSDGAIEQQRMGISRGATIAEAEGNGVVRQGSGARWGCTARWGGSRWTRGSREESASAGSSTRAVDVEHVVGWADAVGAVVGAVAAVLEDLEQRLDALPAEPTVEARAALDCQRECPTEDSRGTGRTRPAGTRCRAAPARR